MQLAFQTTDQRLAKREINRAGPLEWTRNALQRPRNALGRHRRVASGSKAAKKERREERNQEIKKRTKGKKGRKEERDGNAIPLHYDAFSPMHSQAFVPMHIQAF